MDSTLDRLLHALRLFGATMVVAACGTFLVQRWDEAGDVTRYLALLAMTAALPLLAFMCGVRWREGRGARVSLITMLSLVPVHAGVLAGFVFSQFGHPENRVASVAQWVAPSPMGACLLVAGASAVLLPLVWASYRALAREHASMLTALSAFTHGALLIPSRSALSATLLVGPMLALAGWGALRVQPKTREAKVAVASLFAPVLLLFGRQVLFYYAPASFWGVVFGAVAVGLFLLGERLPDRTVTRFSAVPMVLSAGAFWLGIVGPPLWGNALGISPGMQCLLFGGMAAAPLALAAWRSASSRGYFVTLGLGLNAFLVAFVLLLEPGPWVALEAIVLGVGLFSHGFLRGRRASLYAGVGLAVPGAVIEVARAIEHIDSGGWLVLASAGVVLIGGTSWFERHARTRRQGDVKLSDGHQEPMPQ
ncbi:MAG: hypothetical protein AAF436_15910 [Myxococcota bacterium]